MVSIGVVRCVPNMVSGLAPSRKEVGQSTRVPTPRYRKFAPRPSPWPSVCNGCVGGGGGTGGGLKDRPGPLCGAATLRVRFMVGAGYSATGCEPIRLIHVRRRGRVSNLSFQSRLAEVAALCRNGVYQCNRGFWARDRWGRGIHQHILQSSFLSL